MNVSIQQSSQQVSGQQQQVQDITFNKDKKVNSSEKQVVRGQGSEEQKNVGRFHDSFSAALNHEKNRNGNGAPG